MTGDEYQLEQVNSVGASIIVTLGLFIASAAAFHYHFTIGIVVCGISIGLRSLSGSIVAKIKMDQYRTHKSIWLEQLTQRLFLQSCFRGLRELVQTDGHFSSGVVVEKLFQEAQNEAAEDVKNYNETAKDRAFFLSPVWTHLALGLAIGLAIECAIGAAAWFVGTHVF